MIEISSSRPQSKPNLGIIVLNMIEKITMHNHIIFNETIENKCDTLNAY